MSAPDLMAQLSARGLRLDLASSDRLQVSPASALTDDDRALIRVHRAELLALVLGRDLGPDRFCWPHSKAMNTAEIGVFSARLLRFGQLGLQEPAADALADQLVHRDRQGADLHACVECGRFRPWRCTRPAAAGLCSADIGRDAATQVQRCPGFQPVR